MDVTFPNSATGGVMTLLRNELKTYYKERLFSVHCRDHYIIVRTGSCVLLNVYLLCSGTVD